MSDAKRVKRLLKEAREALEREEYDDALASAEEALDLDDSSADVFTSIAVISQRAGRLDKAEQAYQKALKLKPDRPMPLWRGLAETLTAHAAAVAEDPPQLLEVRTELLEALCQFLGLAGDAQGKKVLEMRAAKAQLLHQLGQTDEAIQDFTALLEGPAAEDGWAGLVAVRATIEEQSWGTAKAAAFKREGAALRERLGLNIAQQLTAEHKAVIRPVSAAPAFAAA